MATLAAASAPLPRRPGKIPGVDESPDPQPSPPHADGRARADRELRIAVVVALVALAIGQVLVLTGHGPVALAAIGLPGTIAAVVLARRWQRMASGG